MLCTSSGTPQVHALGQSLSRPRSTNATAPCSQPPSYTPWVVTYVRRHEAALSLPPRVSLALASPVAVWGAWPFHHAAFTNARHGTVTMDTLISVGVGAAFLWSLYALFFGTAGQPGMHMGFALPAYRRRGR